MNHQNAPGVIRFDGYRLVSTTYHCEADFSFKNIEDGKMQLGFQKKIEKLSANEIRLRLRANVFFSDSEDFSQAEYRLTVELAGTFSSEGAFESRWENNALAILFPYMRSFIASVTAQSGREPVILPTVNIAQAFNEYGDPEPPEE